ncbi:DegV family protein [Mesobacillus foraminis]|uniref:DegV family protein n=1 Tax=Mesobacillus foraminis TaxID=279826 RepID=UPI0027D91DCC|nr:DegV family protein [Mesobacillus foraminis]
MRLKKIAWVTDSTAFLDEELRNDPDVFQVPMSIILEGREYMDGLDLSAEELYSKLKTLKEPPKTSQPSVGAFLDLYTKLVDDYDEVFALLVSSRLSGTVDSSSQASKLLGKPVITIDSKILSYPLSALIKRGIALASEGKDSMEIKTILEGMAGTNETYVLIGSLEQLHRSGRMTGAKYLLGSMLSIKPIIAIENGVLVTKDKARSEKKAKEKITQYLRDSHEKHMFKEAWILYGLHPEVAEKWKKDLETEFEGIAFNSYPLGAVIGVHAGEHTIGLSWYNKQS